MGYAAQQINANKDIVGKYWSLIDITELKIPNMKLQVLTN